MPQFDWYQATIDERPWSIVEAVLDGMAEAAGLEEGRGRNGYQSAIKLLDAEGRPVAEVHSGGLNGAPNAFASSHHAPRFAEIIREHWPAAHRVTRADSAHDLASAFWDLHAPLTELARTKGLKHRTVVAGDPEDGSTLYIGSKDSRVTCRVYEKGKEMRAKGHQVTEEQLGLVRFEVQLRPTKEGRETVAGLTPSQCWGASHWTRDLAVSYIGLDPGRQATQFRLTAPFEARVGHMITQYGSTLRELRRRSGDDQRFLFVLSALLEGEN
jgi:hypothetical protein